MTHTANPEKSIIAAFSQCYQKLANIEVVKKHLKHQSVLEHVSFTFKIKVSRVCWEQLVRHRIASYTAQSHRYTDVQEQDCAWYIPTEIKKDQVPEWIEDTKTVYSIYKKWRDKGATRQTSRYLVNKGVAINAIFTMNLRSLLNFLTLRLDKHAQEEIKILAARIYQLVMPTMPNLQESFDKIIFSEETPSQDNSIRALCHGKPDQT